MIERIALKRLLWKKSVIYKTKEAKVTWNWLILTTPVCHVTVSPGQSPSGTTRAFHRQYGWAVFRAVVPVFHIKGQLNAARPREVYCFIAPHPPPPSVRHLRKTKSAVEFYLYSHLASIDLSNNWQNIDVIFFLVRITNPKWVLFIIFLL